MGGMGLTWGTVAGAFMGSACLIQQGFVLEKPTVSNWLNENHKFFRFFNLGYDILIPIWSMASSNESVELQRPFDNSGLENNKYTSYVGYQLNWRSPFSRLGFYGGIDYEWRRFYLSHKVDIPGQYEYWGVKNNIQSLVPAAGIRVRLVEPAKEIEGFPINVVVELGLSYAIALKYENDVEYGLDAINNGFRTQLGLSITTNRFGSLHVRWNKDLYTIFNNGYIATKGFLSNNEIKNNFGYLSVGWATFL